VHFLHYEKVFSRFLPFSTFSPQRLESGNVFPRGMEEMHWTSMTQWLLSQADIYLVVERLPGWPELASMPVSASRPCSERPTWPN